METNRLLMNGQSPYSSKFRNVYSQLGQPSIIIRIE